MFESNIFQSFVWPIKIRIAAVEWTIKEGDSIAGGTIYHLADRMDAGAIVDARTGAS